MLHDCCMGVVAWVILVTIGVLLAAGVAVGIFALVRMTKARVPFDFSRSSAARRTRDGSEARHPE